MNLYGQEPEVRLLKSFLPRLDSRTVIDVGAERGAFADELLRAGSERVHAIEPEPSNADVLRDRFRDDARVCVHECAVSDKDGEVRLHRAIDPAGAPITYGHTLLDLPDTDEIRWAGAVTVRACSLASLVEAGEIPASAAILKVDAEGYDLPIVLGMGDLSCDVVMVEHWTDLPNSLGRCPWPPEAMVSALALRGFSHFASIEHRGEFVILKWDDATIAEGDMGNLVFLHDRVVERLIPDVLATASTLAEGAVAVGELYATAAHERLGVIESLQRYSSSVRPFQLIHLADTLREHRERLETVVSDLAERGEPISELEARLIIEAIGSRPAVVEDALRAEALYGRHGFARVPGLGKLALRYRLRRTPRIGTLRHYPPKPLRVPKSYLRVRLPEAAPRMSIVTPSYEQGRFLARTIYSVLSQNYPELEYFVQDGASSDGTVDVLRRFETELAGWRSEPDAGQADAINRGFTQTSGEIMAWLNSDDLLLPGTLAYVARYFVKHPDVDIVYGNRVMIDEFDEQIGAWILPEHDDFALTLADYVPQETLFWRRRIWEAAGGRVDTSFRYALDWDLLLRFRAAGAKMVRLPRYIGAFRVHAQQKTTVDEAAGLAESDLLRQRLHGRPMSIEEVVLALRPYFAEHIRAHYRQRILDRLPVPRTVVTTVPPGPPVRAGVSRVQAPQDEAALASPLIPR